MQYRRVSLIPMYLSLSQLLLDLKARIALQHAENRPPTTQHLHALQVQHEIKLLRGREA